MVPLGERTPGHGGSDWSHSDMSHDAYGYLALNDPVSQGRNEGAEGNLRPFAIELLKSVKAAPRAADY